MIKLRIRISIRHTLLFLCAVAALNHAEIVEATPVCTPAPFGQSELFLRGTMSNWVAKDEYEFTYQCDAYYLNVQLDGKHEFKIAEESWRDASTVGKPVAQSQTNTTAIEPQLPAAMALATGGISNLSYVFAGTQTVRLAFSDKANRPILSIVAKNMPDRSPRIISDKLALSLRHDSRQPTDKSPFGAVKAGSKDWTREKGANGLGVVDEKPVSNKRIRRFRHTVYSADFVVPGWAKDVVYYYIFPDRFRNGDTGNDPKPGVNTYHDQVIEFHGNWLDKPYLSGTGDGSDKVYSNDFFGGDIAGIIEKLDYIADLGANTLYITPMFTASSNHKYDTADYKNIDPAFGSNADFTRLTVEAAKRGIRVIPDTSLNHTGSDSLYFDRFAKYSSKGAFRGEKVQADSPYASWYTFDRKQSEPDKQYKGWVGVADLPELNKASAEYRRFAFGDKDSVTRMWLERGAAGWRMDVAPWVPDDFWREWRKVVKQQKPDAMTIAETWFDASKYFLGDTFDSAMNYIFRNTILEYAAGGKATALYHNIELMREAYPPQTFFAMMNLLSSHDQPRALHYFGYVDDKTDPATIMTAKQRQRLAMFFQMMFPGSPTIYYGDEVALTGGEDPFNRAAYPWADKGGKPDLQMLADVKAMLKIRKDHAVIRHGSIAAPLLIDEHVIVLARQLGKTWAITATNNDKMDNTVTFNIPEAAATAKFIDAMTGQPIQSTGKTLTLTVPALFGRALISK